MLAVETGRQRWRHSLHARQHLGNETGLSLRDAQLGREYCGVGNVGFFEAGKERARWSGLKLRKLVCSHGLKRGKTCHSLVLRKVVIAPSLLEDARVNFGLAKSKAVGEERCRLQSPSHRRADEVEAPRACSRPHLLELRAVGVSRGFSQPFALLDALGREIGIMVAELASKLGMRDLHGLRGRRGEERGREGEEARGVSSFQGQTSVTLHCTIGVLDSSRCSETPRAE